jgi:low temperature requirement protein LtrA
VAGWLAFMLLFGWLVRRRPLPGIGPTDSMVERFDLLVIIVLGEVVLGVVNGLSAVEHDLTTLGTGLIALVVGFGLWWIFFDIAGRRMPRGDGLTLNVWMESHLPIAIAIAGAGAAMVGLIAHAHDARTPSDTAWLLTGSVAVGLLAMGVTTRTLVDYERHDVVYRPVTIAMVGGAVVALLVGWWQPAPWLLALALAAILSAVWCFAVLRFVAAGVWLVTRDAED